MLNCLTYFLAAWIFSGTAFAGGEAITQALGVLQLKPEEAAKAIPVLLRGVVISGAELQRQDPVAAVVYDGSSAIYLQTADLSGESWKRGNLVEVTGVTGAGQFAPIVVVRSVKVIGKAPIPEPRASIYEDLLSGHSDGQWVELTGIVRSVHELHDSSASKDIVEIATGGGRLAVELSNTQVEPGLVGSLIRVRGICFHVFNQKRQLSNAVIVVPEGELLAILEPAATKPFDLPLRPVGSLLQFDVQGTFGPRVQVQGVVTYRQPGQFFYLQDQERGIQVRTTQNTPLDLGDTVRVVGFPNRGDDAPILEDSIFQVTRHSGRQPEPMMIGRPESALNLDSQLIRIEATVVGRLQQSEGWAMSLQKGEVVFYAFLRAEPGAEPFPEIEAGSQVELVGICSVVMGYWVPKGGLSQSQSFRVLLRNATDLRLLRRPPWWTPHRVLKAVIFGVILAGAVITMLVVSARSRFRKQELERKQAEREFAAILNERNRMAREIHDTLAQDLSAVSIQLETVRKKLADDPATALLRLDRAHAVVRSSLQEARRTIWNMRSQTLESQNLAAALRELLNQETREAGIKAEMCVKGSVRRLPSALENDLLRIGQEAIHNAIRHGHPRELFLELAFGEQSLVLKIQDDGCGFDVARANDKTATHFGLIGMQERAHNNGGKLEIRSAPGAGAAILLEVPLV